MQLLNQSHLMYTSFWLFIWGLNSFIIVATVPTSLQTCAKVLQMHRSGGGGTPCMQLKSNSTFELASTHIFNPLAADFGFKYFHYSGHFAHKLANLCKSAANAHFRGWGDTLLATQT